MIPEIKKNLLPRSGISRGGDFFFGKKVSAFGDLRREPPENRAPHPTMMSQKMAPSAPPKKNPGSELPLSPRPNGKKKSERNRRR